MNNKNEDAKFDAEEFLNKYNFDSNDWSIEASKTLQEAKEVIENLLETLNQNNL